MQLPETVKIEIPKSCIPEGAELVECYKLHGQYVIVDEPDETHNCDEMGCGTMSHVVARLNLKVIKQLRELLSTGEV